MAQRIATSEGAYCSGCGASLYPASELCFSCGQPIESEVAGSQCPQCGRAVEAAATTCPICGTALAARGRSPTREHDLLKEMLEFRRQALEEAKRLGVTPSAMPEETDASLLAELESLWKLSEPFEQVVSSRRKRLEQMDRLIAAARRRIRELENATSPAEVREREELKKQLAQIIAERDEILKIEFGINEMERIYRNIITIQQKELRGKEDALKARLEGFRKELQMRDAERVELAERERALAERERALEARLAELQARERTLAAGQRPENASPEDTREQRAAGQKEAQEGVLQLRRTEGEAGLFPTDPNVRDLRMRLNELEENLEKTAEERARIDRDLTEMKAAQDEVREVLKVLDDLLGQLSDNMIREFARSDGYRKYERLLERLGL